MFPSPPMPSYRQPDNFRNLICKSKLYPQNRSKRLQRGPQKTAPCWNKCVKPCNVCSFTLEKCNFVIGTASGYKHAIEEQVTCETENCIYYRKCIKPNCEDYPNCEYIGKMTRKLIDRLSEHRDYIKTLFPTKVTGICFDLRGHSAMQMSI